MKLPETYRYEWGDTRDGVLTRMRAARTALMNELWNARAPGLPFDTPEQAMVLASIVEKETGIAGERPHVASVFINRLRRGMKLQSDPTVIYGLAPETGELGPLAYATPIWNNRLPANTYVGRWYRLPAPICNPDCARFIWSALKRNHRDLYFVADGSAGGQGARGHAR